MSGYKINIQQILVGSDNTAGGDFVKDLDGANRVVDVRVECKSTSGYSAVVGWNDAANSDVIIPGQSKTYGVAERGYLVGKLAVNFVAGGAGSKIALIEIWTEGEEVCN